MIRLGLVKLSMEKVGLIALERLLNNLNELAPV